MARYVDTAVLYQNAYVFLKILKPSEKKSRYQYQQQQQQLQKQHQQQQQKQLQQQHAAAKGATGSMPRKKWFL